MYVTFSSLLNPFAFIMHTEDNVLSIANVVYYHVLTAHSEYSSMFILKLKLPVNNMVLVILRA